MGCGCSKVKVGPTVNTSEDGGIPTLKEEDSNIVDELTASSSPQTPAARRLPATQRMGTAPIIMHKFPSMANLVTSFSQCNSHVMIVDDDERSRTVMVKWLEEAEYTVTPCLSGTEAVDVLTLAGEDQERVEDISLVLCDTNMSTEDDKKLLDWILANEKTKHIPVILMSADATVQSANRSIRRGGEDFLLKPVGRTLLLKTLQTILENILEQRNAHVLKQRGDKYKELVLAEEKAMREANLLPGQQRVDRGKTPSPPPGGRDTATPHHATSIATTTGATHLGLGLNSGGPIIRASSPSFYSNQPMSPMSRTGTYTPQSQPRPSIASTDNAHILLVDPDENSNEEARKWLAEVAFSVTVFTSPAAAFEYMLNAAKYSKNLVTNKALSRIQTSLGEHKTPPARDIDLLICELDMPEMSGYQLLEKVFNEPACRGIPIVLLSASKFTSEHISRSLKLGCENFIQKPLSKDLFVKKVQTIVFNVAQKKHGLILVDRVRKYKGLLDQKRSERERRGGPNSAHGGIPGVLSGSGLDSNGAGANATKLSRTTSDQNQGQNHQGPGGNLGSGGSPMRLHKKPSTSKGGSGSSPTPHLALGPGSPSHASHIATGGHGGVAHTMRLSPRGMDGYGRSSRSMPD